MALFTLIFFSKPIIAYMGQPEAVVEMAKPYLTYRWIFIDSLIMYQAYKQFAQDGLSETKYSMWATIIGNITNVVINYF